MGAVDMVCVDPDEVRVGGATDGVDTPRSCGSVPDCPVCRVEDGRPPGAAEAAPTSPSLRDERLPSPTKVVMKLSKSCRSRARAAGGEATLWRQGQLSCQSSQA